jgi:DNA polymerase-2
MRRSCFCVRRDWTEVSKKFQLELLDNIFHDKPIENYIKNFANDLKKGKYDSLLIYKKAIRKAVSSYEF